MAFTRVLLLGSPRDGQMARLRTEIRKRGGRAVTFDTTAFPESLRLALSAAGAHKSRGAIPAFGAVYVRSLAYHPLSPGAGAELAERPRGYLAQREEKRAFLESWLLMLERDGVRIVNTVAANAQHRQKPFQLRLLEEAGLPAPRWLATNDPVQVKRFTKEVGRAIYKPLAGGATVRALEESDLRPERLDTLALAPVLFQERIEGVPVRAFVVNRRVTGAAEIHSGELDYRRDEQAVVPTQLSRSEREACLRAARVCGMPFTGVDLIRTEAGFVVIECNPSPMFAIFEQKTGCDIAGPLADYLLEGR